MVAPLLAFDRRPRPRHLFRGPAWNSEKRNVADDLRLDNQARTNEFVEMHDLISSMALPTGADVDYFTAAVARRALGRAAFAVF